MPSWRTPSSMSIFVPLKSLAAAQANAMLRLRSPVAAPRAASVHCLLEPAAERRASSASIRVVMEGVDATDAASVYALSAASFLP